MKQYLTQFDTKNEYLKYKYTDAPNTHVSYISENDEVVYAHIEGDEYAAQPFSIISLDPNTPGAGYDITIENVSSEKSTDGKTPYLKYSYDGKIWYTEGLKVYKDRPTYIVTNYAPTETVNIRLTDDAPYKAQGNLLSICGGYEKDNIDGIKYHLINAQDVENLWVPNINDLTYLLQNTNITKAPHIIVGKKKTFFNETFKNTGNLADISNIRFDVGKDVILNTTFNSTFNLETASSTPLPIFFPQFLTIDEEGSWMNNTFIGTFANRTLAPLTDDIFILATTNKPTNYISMFNNVTINDLSHLHIMTYFGGDLPDYVGDFLGASTIQKGPKIYKGDNISENLYTSCSNLTDVYFYGYTLPSVLGLDSSYAGNIHYAPWINSGQVDAQQANYPSATFVEDTDAIMLTVMREAANDGERWTIDGKTYMGGRTFWTATNYPSSFHFNEGETDAAEFLDNPNFMTHVIIGDEWVPVTYIEDTNLDDSEDWWDQYNFHKYSYTYNGATHYMFFARLEGGFGVIRDIYLPFRLVYSKNLPDSFKFKYIN